MSSPEKTNPIRARVVDEGVPPPPRLLLGAVIGLFIVGLVIAIVALVVLRNGFALSSLLELAVILSPLITIGSILAAAIFRKSLPRRFTLWLVGFWLVVWVIGSLALVVVHRNALAPGQRETVKHYLPFMAMFDPPLPPPDSSLPTPIPGGESNLSPADLLNSAPALNIGTPNVTAPHAQTTAALTTVPTVQASSTIVATLPTIEPTQAAVSTAQPDTSVVVNSAAPLSPQSAHLYGITPVKQGWNECGPANITMALSFYGWKQDLNYAANYLKPDREDKNVNPWELVSFVNEESGVRALTRIGGDMALLKQLISNNLPVLIETGYMYEGSSWLGHYQTVVGYDDAAGVFYVFDSYLGTGENGSGMPKKYSDFDQFWDNFNRTFIVLYKKDEENLVRSILRDRADVTKAAEMAADTARTEAKANPLNAFAWFNLGSSLTKIGEYDQAVRAFDESRRIGTLPWRITLYQFGPFEAYFNVGRYNEVQALVDAAMLNGGNYVEEIYYWQGKILAAQGDNAKAASAFKQALAHNPKYTAASDALEGLPT